MTDITLEEQQEKLYGYEKGYHAMHLMNAGVELGLFQLLNTLEGFASSDDLAGRLGLHEPYVRIWCQTAYHLGILDCDELGRYRLAPNMGTLLSDTTSPYYFGHRARFVITHLTEGFKTYPGDLRNGSSWFYDDLEGDRGRQFSRDLKALANQMVPTVFIYVVIPRIPGLKEKLSAGARVLDVGCGSGLLMIRLAQAFPDCEFVGIELDRFAVEDAQTGITDNRLEDRVSALLVNAASMGYDGEFDLVTMGFVLHEISPELKHISLANCYRALKDSGEIAILDFAYPETLEDFRSPKYSLGIMDQFFETTWGSQHLSSAARHQLLLEQGFKNPATIAIAGGSLEATHARK